MNCLTCFLFWVLGNQTHQCSLPIVSLNLNVLRCLLSINKERHHTELLLDHKSSLATACHLLSPLSAAKLRRGHVKVFSSPTLSTHQQHNACSLRLPWETPVDLPGTTSSSLWLLHTTPYWFPGSLILPHHTALLCTLPLLIS